MTTEFDVANQLISGALQSPARFMNAFFVVIRISGTGAAYRLVHDEITFRDPRIWLTTEMQRRCIALPITLGHPPGGILSVKSFRETIVGIVVATQVRGSELWGVGKFYDGDLALALTANENASDTSPSVCFAPDGTSQIKLADGTALLIEGEPNLIDHVAIVAVGVWSKGLGTNGIDKAPPPLEGE